MYKRHSAANKQNKLTAALLAVVLTAAFSASAVSAQPIAETELSSSDQNRLKELRGRLSELESALTDQETVISYTESQISILEEKLIYNEEQIEIYKTTVINTAAASSLNQTVLEEYESYRIRTEDSLSAEKANLDSEVQSADALRGDIAAINDEILDITTLDGNDVARYALQFEGNPYVYGGTSLTKGCDCSGFIMSLYKEFDQEIGRSSWDQESAGTEVSYEEMQPGDIICYGGHVAMYIGNGQIIHAKDSASGIVIEDDPNYQPIRTIRRIFA